MKLRWVVVMALATSSLVACGPDSASVTERRTPEDIRATLAWMQERTLTCAQVPAANPARQWTCTGESHWDQQSFDRLTITIERDDAGRTHLVAAIDATLTKDTDLCPNLTCDGYTGFFSDTVALSPVLGADGAEVGAWVDAHARTGGQTQIGLARVDYRPGRPILTMTIDIAAHADP